MHKGRILIIDDDSDFVEINRMALEAAGYQISAAYNGREGLGKIQAEKPDLILLDVMMTTVTEGLDLAYELREKEEYRGIPIFLITSMTSAPEFPQSFTYVLGRDWPVTKYFDKPVKPAQIVAAVGEVLAK
ncbi:MAG: response regulator [Bacillota bacterium]